MDLKVVVIAALVVVGFFLFGFFGLLPNPIKKTVSECEDQPSTLLKDVCYTLKAKAEKNKDWCNSVSTEVAKAKCQALFKAVEEAAPAPSDPSAPAAGTPSDSGTPAPSAPSTPPKPSAPAAPANLSANDLVPAKAGQGEFSVDKDEALSLSDAGFVEGQLLALKKTEDSDGTTTVEIKAVKFQSKTSAKDYFNKEKGTMLTNDTTKAFDEGLSSICFSTKFDAGYVQKTTRVLCRREEFVFSLAIENKDTNKDPSTYIGFFGEPLEAKLVKSGR